MEQIPQTRTRACASHTRWRRRRRRRGATGLQDFGIRLADLWAWVLLRVLGWRQRLQARLSPVHVHELAPRVRRSLRAAVQWLADRWEVGREGRFGPSGREGLVGGRLQLRGYHVRRAEAVGQRLVGWWIVRHGRWSWRVGRYARWWWVRWRTWVAEARVAFMRRPARRGWR